VILFFLLGNIRAALITALAIPLSMLMAATGMVRAGVSGNLMSLGAIDFGLIVDGAIIIVENSLARLAEAQRVCGRRLDFAERLRTVLAASAQVVRPTAFGVGIITIVYVPLLALSGVEGKMFEPMALTVMLALSAAFVLSLTFVPAAVAVVVRGPVSEREVPLVRLARRVYAPLLGFTLAHRVPVIAAATAAFFASLLLFARLGQEFAPTLDERDFAVHAIRIPGTGLEQSSAMQLEVERALGAFPEVAAVFSKTGTADIASDPMPPNVSDTFVIVRPRAEWPNPGETKDALRERLQAAVAVLPGNNYEWTQPIEMRFNELLAGVRSDVAVKVFGDDPDALRAAAERIAAVLRSMRGAADVRVEESEGLPELLIEIDREAAGRLGLSVAAVQDVVGAAIGGRGVGLVFQGDRRFELVVRLGEERRRDLEALRSLPVPLPGVDEAPEGAAVRAGLLGDGSLAPRTAGGFVPLASIATIRDAVGPAQIGREDGHRRALVQANVRGRDLGSFVAEAERRVGDVALPPGSWVAWGGQYENLVSARARLSIVVPACFLSILGLLYLSFRAWSPALIVFSGVPLGLSGGVLALWARDIPFSISAAVGFIALSGVAVLNGLVLVSFVRELQQQGTGREDAARDGALARLRPVITTALVASLGFVPMALATGTGAEVQRPLATVVIGGLITSTLLTLLVLPALYSLLGPRSGPRPSVRLDPAQEGAA
jgi:cobalt-zinc-cadmium resistance protein CzcA